MDRLTIAFILSIAAHDIERISSTTIGDTFEFDPYTLTQEEIIEFAEQYDPQPFYIDEQAA